MLIYGRFNKHSWEAKDDDQGWQDSKATSNGVILVLSLFTLNRSKQGYDFHIFITNLKDTENTVSSQKLSQVPCVQKTGLEEITLVKSTIKGFFLPRKPNIC